MSATQSEGKNHDGKTSMYYGLPADGYQSSRDSELTRDDDATLQRLREFSPDDFEAFSIRGEEYRRHLCSQVLKVLPISKAWSTDYECAAEWGGVFPVHLRLTHRKKRHITLDILSPGSESPFWHCLIWVIPGHTGLYILNTEQFEPQAIGQLLMRVEEMLSAGIVPADIVAQLGRKGRRG